MTEEGKKFIQNFTKNYLTNWMNELFKNGSPQMNAIEVITFTNQAKTRGTLQSGAEVDVVPQGMLLGSQAVGYRIGEGKYLCRGAKKKVLRSGRRRTLIPWLVIGAYANGSSTSGTSHPASKPEFNLVNGDTLQKYRIPREDLTGIYVDLGNNSAGVSENNSGFWQVALSSTLNCIVMTRLYPIQVANLPATTELRAYWAIIKDFTLDADNSVIDLSGATVEEGNAAYTYAGNAGSATQRQRAMSVITIDSDDNVTIDVVGDTTSGSPTGVDLWSAVDITDTGTITTGNNKMSQDLLLFGSPNRGSIQLRYVNNPLTRGYRQGDDTTRIAFANQTVSSPRTAGRYRYNPYDTEVETFAGGTNTNCYIADITRAYGSYVSDTNWLDGTRVKVTGTGEFSDIIDTDVTTASVWQITEWAYNSDLDTMEAQDIYTSSTFPSTFYIERQSGGTTAGYFITDWTPA